MRFITTKTHGMLDYLMGILLMASPWLLGFSAGGPATWVPFTLGATTLLFSLLTDYELGALKLIPMRVHLILDLLTGLFLGVSPWLLNFDEYVYLPHLVLGIVEVLVVLCSSPVAYAKSRVVGYPPQGRP